jgi:hypothetical protein
MVGQVQEQVPRLAVFGEHSEGCRPLGAHLFGNELHALICALIGIPGDDSMPPLWPSEDLIEDSCCPSMSRPTLTDLHVELPPDYVDEESNAASPHELGKESPGNAESVGIDEDEGRGHSVWILLQVSQRGFDRVEAVSAARFDLNARRECAETIDLTVKGCLVGLVAFDEDEAELAAAQETIAVGVLQERL